MGYNFTAKQAEGRWKTLLSSYRRGKDMNRQTGIDRKATEFEDALDDLLLDRHDTTPVYTLLSSSTRQSEEPVSDGSQLSTPSCQREEDTRIQVSHLKRHARRKEDEKALQLKLLTF
ncbi:hypothetical protein DPMN_153658 [Dreissena polymorpha]|uniref:Uncharacterized protein n=1 Tax=Dreissena polymorpha TaxID=45954 RepID=A0A9D4FJK0_DREPO|nr:hypothetical protein DPMN_153658 [Dreissena polymorpha]